MVLYITVVYIPWICNALIRLKSTGFNDSDVQSYYNFMVDMAALLGAEPEKAKIEMEDSLRFEIKLANVSSTRTSSIVTILANELCLTN